MGLLTRLLEQKHNTERDRVKFEFERDQSILTNPNSSEAQYQAALERMIDAAAPTPAHAKGMKAIFPKLLQRNLGSDPQTGQPYNRGMANASGVDSTTGDSVAWGPNGEITRTPRAGMGGQQQPQGQQQQQPSMRQQPQLGTAMPNSWDGGYSGLDGQPHTADGYRTPKPTDSTGVNSTLPMGADGRPRLSNHGEYDGGVPPAAGIVPGVDDSGIGGTGIAQLAGNDLTASATTFNDRQPSVYGPFSLAGKATGSGSGSDDADTGEVDSSPAAGFDAGIGAGFVKNPAAAAQKKSTSDATAVTGNAGAGTDNSAARLPDPFSAYQGRNFEPSATSDDGHLLNVAKGSRPTIQKGPYNTPTDPFDAFKPGTTHGEDQVNQWWQMGGVPIDMSRGLPPVNTSKPPKKRMIPSGQSWKQEQPYSPQNLIGAGEGEDVNSLPRLAITQGGSDNRYRAYNGDTGRELPSLSGPGNGGWSKVYPSVMGKKVVDDFNKHVPSYSPSLPPLAQGNVASTQPASSGTPNASPAPVPAPTTTPTPAPVTPKPVFPTATVAPKPVQPQAAPAAALSPQGGASAPVRHSPAPLPPQVPSVVPPTVPVGAPQTPVPGAEAQQQPGMNFPAGMTGSFPYGDPYETFDGVPGHPLSVNARIARQAMGLLAKGVTDAQVAQFVMQQKIANLQRLREQNPGLPPSQLYALAGIPIPGQAAAESRERVAAGQPVPQGDYVQREDGAVGFNTRRGEFKQTFGTKMPVKPVPQTPQATVTWNNNNAAWADYLNSVHQGEPGYRKTADTLTPGEIQDAQQQNASSVREIHREIITQHPDWSPKQVMEAQVAEIQRQRKIGENSKVVRAEIGVKTLDNLNQKDEQAVTFGEALINGSMPPTMVNIPRDTKAKAQAYALEHGYNATLAEADWLALQSHIRTMEGPVVFRQVNALDKLLTTIPLLRQAYKNWESYGRDSGIKIFNRAALAASKQFGGPVSKAANELDRLISETVPELASIYSAGNTPTDHGLELGKTQLAGEWNSDNFHTALNGIEQFATIRRNTFKTSQPGSYAGSDTNQYAGQQQQPKAPWRTPPQPGAAITKQIADQYHTLYPDVSQMRAAIQADGWKIPR